MVNGQNKNSFVLISMTLHCLTLRCHSHHGVRLGPQSLTPQCSSHRWVKMHTVESESKMLSLVALKGMLSLVALKGMLSLVALKGMLSLVARKGMLSLVALKGILSLVALKGMLSLVALKGIIRSLGCSASLDSTVWRTLWSPTFLTLCSSISDNSKPNTKILSPVYQGPRWFRIITTHSL